MEQTESSPSTTPSIPLQMAGFLAGTTIHVEGDAGNLHFSGHFDIHQQPISNVFGFPLPSPSNPLASLLSPMAPVTPTVPVNLEGSCTGGREDIAQGTESGALTRLRSGAISPISYIHRRARTPSSKRPKRAVIERLLQRRSVPLRPCNAYSFFVMANWDFAKAASFEGTSRRLKEIWHELSERDKRVYTVMATKDKARYKKQCVLWMKKGEN